MQAVAFPIDASNLIALALVGFYAASRFSTPRTVRYQTSRFQYFGSCATYVLSCLGLLMLLTWLLVQYPDLLNFLHFGSSETLPPKLGRFEAPLRVRPESLRLHCIASSASIGLKPA